MKLLENNIQEADRLKKSQPNSVDTKSPKTEASNDQELSTVRGKLLETSQDLENAQEVFKFDISKTVSAINALAKYIGEVYSQNMKASSDDYLPLKRKLEICYNDLETTYEEFQSDLNNVKALMGKATSALFVDK